MICISPIDRSSPLLTSVSSVRTERSYRPAIKEQEYFRVGGVWCIMGTQGWELKDFTALRAL